jgi:toxin ParE1/3/4
MRASKTSFSFRMWAASSKPRGVRKFVTRKYAYLVYYTVDEAADEIIILNVKHPAQRREHEDA